MDHYMPEIFYHDRKAILSVDFHPIVSKSKYKIATSSVQTEVRLWEFHFEKVNLPVAPLAVDYVASLSGHAAAVNQVKFSPNPELNLLASGDCHGRIAIWQLSDQPCSLPPLDDFPPNKENWVRIKVLNHENDVVSLCWSPCGKFLASVSNDDSLQIHEAVTGKRTVCVSHLRHFPNGLSWDPFGKYIVTMSTDRKMDLFDAQKGTKLRTFGAAELPKFSIFHNENVAQGMYKFFHDDQLMCFQRSVAFSPCGQLIVAPSCQIESGANDIFGTLVFKRCDLDKDVPFAILPSKKPTFLVRFCPIVFDLDTTRDENYSGLPYRLIWLTLTKDSILFYDSQHYDPIGLVENIHYNNITEASWSKDGNVVVISSLEGYISYLKLKIGEWGVQIEQQISELERPASPVLIQNRKRVKKEKKKETTEQAEASTTSPDRKLTPLRNISQPVTPKTPSTPKVSLLKFFKKEEKNAEISDEPPAEAVQPSEAPRPKKRVDLISIT